MKTILFAFAFLAILSVSVRAQEAADYQAWMKDVAATNAQLGKDLGAKSGDAAAADAKKLAGIFAQVHGYWQKKGTDDATKFAADAQSGFAQVGDLAAAGKFDDASAAAKTTAATCAGCHAAHRSRGADGSFSIK